MPSAISRKTRSVRAKTAAASTKQQSASIADFARVSKLHTVGKDVTSKNAAAEAGRSSTIEIVLSSRKRKADDEFELVAPSSTNGSSKKPRREPEAQPVEPSTPTTRKRKTVTFALPEVEAATSTPIPRANRKRNFQADEDTKSEHESAEAEALLERLNLQSSPARKRTKTLNTTPTSQSHHDVELPQELLDLLDLHISFLKTLSMQIAHNGMNTPIDLRSMCPSITQSWGKRTVTVDDIRRCIGILTWSPVKGSSSSKSSTQPPFFLSDYGRGKICIDYHPDAEPGPLREQKLNMDFEANLRTIWFGRHDQNMQLFIASLPQAAIKKCASVAKAGPALEKGQRTLEELKNGIVRKKQEQEEAKAAVPVLKADGTKMSLLDRIRFKETLQSQSAQGPTPAELQRRAALQRVEDVAAVIGMLCLATSTGQSRMAFTMTALLTKLKDSLRTPIASEDGVCCVKLLAAEIAPQWLRIVTIGGKENVVVQTALQPSKMALQEKVAALLG
ncbi:hypothetical protein B0T22DRAFT_466822 [Podospora appendiculata]|uniref:DNA replication factor Cdt1 C-terminal domain-containing protein n=1 Tax=Podospora appendiculata TaxID=314037 RepID=A0AAE0X6V6_9PEZI|nr:hypothetical protein B0T22DRAFT_466822 [Podospora appendiculata]